MDNAEVPESDKPLPPTYDREKVEEVIERLYEGETLTSICKEATTPFSIGMFLRWVRHDYEDLAKRYARARQIGWEVMAEDYIDICDNDAEDADVQRDTLRANGRKWVISKRLPDYSDQKQPQEGASEIIAAAMLAMAGKLPD